jgi:hypothetical protein
VSPTDHRREFPYELARAGEARQFIAWTGAVAGLRGGSLSDLAVAAEAVLTDIFLSGEGGTLEIESVTAGGAVSVIIHHPEIGERRMASLGEIMDQYLDGYEISPDRAVLVKRLK